jgi:transposase InsO family protein
MTAPFTTASYGLNTKISMDSVGPLPMSEEGYIHLLVIIDNFSRYNELYPLRDLTAKNAARRIVEHIGRHGCPNLIQFDNGSQFCNQIISETIKLVGTESVKTLAYSKEENAIVERSNKEVLRHIRALVYEIGKHNDWPNFIPFVQRILNSEVSSATGVSPNALRYGDTVDLDRGIYLPLESTSESVTQYSTWPSIST